MLSATGNPYVQTPNLDRLAERGLRFEGAYCSNPMCVPSRFSMFTGRYGSDSGIHGLPEAQRHTKGKTELEHAREALGWQMRAAGYETYFGGKRHFPKRPNAKNLDKLEPVAAEDLGFEFIEKDEREMLATTSADWLKARAKAQVDKPFFLVNSFINPHDICYMGLRDFPMNDFEKMLVERGVTECAMLDDAMTLPEGMDEATFFAEVCPPLPENFLPQEDEPGAIQVELERRPFRAKMREEWDERRWRLHRWAYARLTERVDREIGKVLDALEESSLDESTWVIFVSDHGDMDGSHQLEHKDVLYQENLKVPLLVSPPRSLDVAPRVVDASSLVCTGLDLMPTFCEIAGTQAPEGLPGVSFLPIVKDKADKVRDFVPIESEIGHAVVTERFKLCRYFEGQPREQFFDLQAQPGEMRSVQDPNTHAEERQRLAAYYAQAGLWQE